MKKSDVEVIRFDQPLPGLLEMWSGGLKLSEAHFTGHKPEEVRKAMAYEFFVVKHLSAN